MLVQSASTSLIFNPNSPNIVDDVLQVAAPGPRQFEVCTTIHLVLMHGARPWLPAQAWVPWTLDAGDGSARKLATSTVNLALMSDLGPDRSARFKQNKNQHHVVVPVT